MTTLPGYVTVQVSRPAEERPGSSPRPAMVKVFAGERSWLVYLDAQGAGVEATNALAGFIELVLPTASSIIAERDADCTRMGESIRRLETLLADTRSKLASVLTGRARLHGRAFVRVADSGEAWLMDPKKRDGGYGLAYPSLTDIWQAWPSLRPVEWGADAEGPVLIVEAMAMGEDR